MLLQAISGIPDPLHVQEQESLILIISLVLGSISSLAVICSAIFAYLQWKKTKYENKVHLVELIREKLYDDKDVRHIIYLIDYGIHWYDADFHNSEEPQGSVDKTLSIIEYACYMCNQGILGPKEFELIKYDIDRITQSRDVQEYLWNLYHWCNKINSRCSFLNVVNYALDNGLWVEEFKESEGHRFRKYLNF